MKKQILLLGAIFALAGCCTKMETPCCDKLKKDYQPVVHFAFDSAELTSKDKRTLQELPHRLKDCPEITLKVTGYTDNTGTAKYNMTLGKLRAEAVEAYLLGLDFKGRRIHTMSMGEQNPVATNHTEDGRAMNRRAVIELK